MRVDALEAAIAEDTAAGVRPIAVVATLGTTSSTSVDPVAAIADVAARNGLWLHVDAAYAGPVAIIPERRGPFAGWERADSIVVNPHKWLFTPLDASLLLTRRMDALRAAFSLVPEYLRTLDRAEPGRDFNEYQPQLGRRMRALKLWILLRWFGLDGLRRRIGHHLELAERFAASVDVDPDWQRLAPVPFSTVCFRWRPSRLEGREDEPEVRALLDDAQRGDHGCGQPDRRGLPVAHAPGRPVRDPPGDRQHPDRAAPRRARLGAPPARGGTARWVRSTRLAAGDRAAALSTALDRARAALTGLDLGDAYDPAAPAAIVAAGLHLAPVPVGQGGFGIGPREAVELLASLAAIDGSTALGFAMHVHVVGSMADSPGWPTGLRERLYARHPRRRRAAQRGGHRGPWRQSGPWRAPRDDRDPRRRRLPPDRREVLDHLAAGAPVRAGDGPAGVRGGSDGRPTRIGLFVVDLEAPGITRLPGFEALGMRGSASGRLRLEGVRLAASDLVIERRATDPDPRGPSPAAWFGLAIAGVYLGVGEGAREAVVRWAVDRRPGDGSSAVADLPTVQVRLGRIDAALRAARVVVLDVAGRWQATPQAERAGLMADVALAKLAATNAAATATDEALRIAGGPGFLAGRLERAFRDARAGLINPPLEDVALAGFARTLIDRAKQDRAGETSGRLGRSAGSEPSGYEETRHGRAGRHRLPDVHRWGLGRLDQRRLARGPQPGHRRAGRTRPGGHRGGRRPGRGRGPGRVPGRALARMLLPERVAILNRLADLIDAQRRRAGPARDAPDRHRLKLRRDSDFAFASDNLRFFAGRDPPSRGQGRRRVQHQPHQHGPPRADRRRSARSRPGTTRS